MRILGAVGLGLTAGYVSLAAGVIGLAVALLLTAVIVVWLRRNLSALSIYLAVLGATGVAILLPTIIGRAACPGSWNGPVTAVGNCYAPSTVPALVVYAVFVAIGSLLAGVASVRGFGRPSS
jgi:hypothetical protein